MRKLPFITFLIISFTLCSFAQTPEPLHTELFAASSQNQVQQASRPVSLRGRVVDARTGEPIAKVKIIVVGAQQSTTTDQSGAFTLPNLPPGDVELYITTVSYGLVIKTLQLKEGENAEAEIALSQEAAALTEHVTVIAGPYEETEPTAASEHHLNKTELRMLSTMLLNDPVRAAQSLPSATANDDFRSEFAVRGAGFERVGVYVDGVRTENFVHTLQGNFLDTGSLSIINADTLSSVSLLSGAFPAKYGNSTAAAFNLETRAGNRVKPAGRISVGLSNSSGVVDGPFAKSRGAWLFAARKSYLGYFTRRFNEALENTNDPPIVDFADVQGRAVYDLTSHQQLGISAIFGTFHFDRNRPLNELGRNAIFQGETRNLLINAHWSYTPGPRFFAQTRVFGLQSNFTNTNRDKVTLDDGLRTQFGARGDINFLARPEHRLEAGVYVRARHVERFSARFQAFQSVPLRDLESFDRRATEHSYYAQDTWSSEHLGLSVTGGARIEHSGLTSETLVSPRASLSFSFAAHWRVRAAFGKHYQFPDFEELFGRLGSASLRAERATHYNASLERTFGSRTRVLAEVYDRAEAHLFFSLSEPRIEAGRVTFTEFPLRNALRGHARGLELTLQRRSANGLTGWLSYAYAKTRLQDQQSGLRFVSDYDQRHTLNLYASYRFTETFHLSGQWRYGSGMPLPGFFRRSGSQFFLASERNLIRLPAYSRVDVRANKAFLFKKWKLTLYGEVLNVLNRQNLRYTGFEAYGPRGEVLGKLDRTLPIVPSGGVVMEF